MQKRCELVKTEKQKEAIKKISENVTTLLEGGGRSGKSMIIVYVIFVRALLVTSKHLITRFKFSHAKQSFCYDTIPKLIKILGLSNTQVSLNKTDWFYEFSNGSTIWIGGIDDKERTEKILGNEYDTIYINEASQITFEAYEMLLTRLNPRKGVSGKMLIDYNPPSSKHWGYKIFHDRKFPDGRSVPETDFAFLQMNPLDNLENISEQYIKNLENLSYAKRQRFLYGNYANDVGTLIKRECFSYISDFAAAKKKIIRIVIGVDPAGTVEGDEIGIVVDAELNDGTYMCLDDVSLHGTPAEWAEAVCKAYDIWEADLVVAEKNYGGDMVEHTIKSTKKFINVKLVNSSRGKVLRAEPMAALYEKKLIKHLEIFVDLENEMCNYVPGVSKSPNRMDAHAFAINELINNDVSILDVI